jgi:carboxynorspermidine decarboxylase
MKQLTDFSQLDTQRLPSPCFVVDEVAIERNLALLAEVQAASGAKILHALKAFSMWSLAPLTRRYLSGTCSSGLHEALLAKEHYGGEVHVFSAAFKAADLEKILSFADHVVFNSCEQLVRFAPLCLAAISARPELRIGLRVNPEHSEGDVPIYDPCAPGSRLGVPVAKLQQFLVTTAGQEAFKLVSGLHFHTLCEHGFAPLARTLAVFEQRFSPWFSQLEWVNFGGGHHITAEGYDTQGLIATVKAFRERYSLDVYLEPGEAVAIGTGVLVSEVLDVTETSCPQLILDTSATCHMPDTLEMPYRAEIMGAGEIGEYRYSYRLGGLTCLAGDVMGDYSFDMPVQVGQRLMFMDMSHYTMVKTSTFNGTALPAIAIWNSNSNQLTVVKEFGYSDFKQRLS